MDFVTRRTALYLSRTAVYAGRPTVYVNGPAVRMSRLGLYVEWPGTDASRMRVGRVRTDVRPAGTAVDARGNRDSFVLRVVASSDTASCATMCYMSTVQRAEVLVGVRELRQNLSVYLARLSAGTVFRVTDRGKVMLSGFEHEGRYMGRICILSFRTRRDRVDTCIAHVAEEAERIARRLGA